MNILDFLADKLNKTTRTPPPYQALGGERVVLKIAQRFYTIMEQDPIAAELYSIHPKPLDRIRQRFFLYLSMWLGGPNDYEQQRGHPRLRARHLPFKVTPALKEQWMYCMRKAMLENVQDLALAEQLLSKLDQLAEHMINSQ